jgi:hypothetical protein
MYYYRMCAAGMTHVEDILLGDIDEYLRPFAKLGLDYVKQLSAWDSTDVSTALAHHRLDSDGTLAEQKQHPFDLFLRTWEPRVNDSYTPKDEAVKQLFSAAIDYAVGVLKAEWDSFKVSQDGPSNVAGEDFGLTGVSPGASDGTANMPASSRGVEHAHSPSGFRPSLRAGETVFYHDPLYIPGQPRARRETRILAIRMLGPNGGGGKGGVRVKR